MALKFLVFLKYKVQKTILV